jgi:flagellar motor switch protein FliG
MLRFEDLLQVEATALQRFFPEVPALQWALALRGWDEEATQKLLSVLPARAAQLIREERELIGPRPVRDVELARAEICEKARVKGLLPLKPAPASPRPATR